MLFKFSRNRNQAKERLNRFRTRKHGVVVMTAPPPQAGTVADRIPPSAGVCVNRLRFRAGVVFATLPRNEAIPVPERIPPYSLVSVNRWKLRPGYRQQTYRRDDTPPAPQRIPPYPAVCIFRTPPVGTARTRWVRGGFGRQVAPQYRPRPAVFALHRRRPWLVQPTRDRSHWPVRGKKLHLRMRHASRVFLKVRYQTRLLLTMNADRRLDLTMQHESTIRLRMRHQPVIEMWLQDP